MSNDKIILEMNVQMTIIDNLGIKMYSNVEAVLGELISNAYDADATEVNIRIPTGQLSKDSEIIIEDNGSGISLNEINSTYLNLGRNRRDDPSTAITPVHKRKVMGRKGIGKLSAFGIADTIEITTQKDKLETAFLLNINDIRKTPVTEKYKPLFTVASADNSKSGTRIRLKDLTRKRGFSLPQLKSKIARRFSCIDSTFQLSINGNKITPEERNLKDRCELKFEYKDLKIDPENELIISGWIGTFPQQVPSDIAPGVVIMVRGKLAQEATFFDAPTSGWINMAKFYLVGEIYADFLDDDDGEDLILTNRSSVDWSSEFGLKLQTWGQEEIKKIAKSWGENQKKKKEKVIREDPEFTDWLEGLSTPEKKVANKVINAITADGVLPDERVKELTGYIKSSFEFQVFKELAAVISEEPTVDDRKLIELFEEWDIIEAREVHKVAEGRLLAIQQLEKMIVTNAREVPEIHQFLASYPWILDPSWTIAYDETYYSTLLKDNFKEPQEKPDINRRLDFVCIGAGDTIHVVELKRPRAKIGKDELSQLEEYVAFIKQQLGNAPNGRSYRSASGYIIGEDIKDDFYTKEKIETLEKNRMYVRKYADLLSMAKKLHHDFSEKIKSKS
ncbi:ATP-binding protein [Leptospira koniambonensis]|nr:ATP-binding protein [Leptospira koniambonensis]